MEAKKELSARLARIEGQVAALRRSLESDSVDCSKTLTQAKAASQALKRFTEEFAREYARNCIAANRGAKGFAKELDEIISAAYSLS